MAGQIQIQCMEESRWWGAERVWCSSEICDLGGEVEGDEGFWGLKDWTRCWKSERWGVWRLRKCGGEWGWMGKEVKEWFDYLVWWDRDACSLGEGRTLVCTDNYGTRPFFFLFFCLNEKGRWWRRREEGDYCSHGTPINWAFNMIHTKKKNDMGCPRVSVCSSF